MTKLELEKIAVEVRKGIITGVHSAKSGHPGGSLSAAEIFTYLYFVEMNVDPKNPKDPNRDRFVLSKGHVAPGLYATLAQKGYFPVEELEGLRHIGSMLQGHPDMKHIPGIDMSSGSLGQGFSAAVGMALAAKMDGKDYRVYSLAGDGEIQEGQVWEAASLAAQQKLSNLIAFVDWNKQQLDGAIDDVLDIGDIGEKFRAFGWHVQQVNGHDVDAVKEAVEQAKAHEGQPSMIVLDTIKGNGCRLAMETFPCHHLKFKPEQIAPSVIEAEKVLAEARKALEVE